MKQKIINMLELQDSMNSKVNADWRNAGNEWYRAIWMEASEMLEHYGWKWWKKQDKDLAQLQMEQESWRPMYDTMVRACGDPLQDRFVGRANLLLGVSQLKLGDNVAARRSFINATLIGGVNAQAGQWLQFMNAAPATERGDGERTQRRATHL